MVIHNQPNDPLAGNEFGYFHFALMDILVTIRPLNAGAIGAAFNLFGPPSPDIVDGMEYFIRGLVYSKRSCVTFSLHCLVSFRIISAAAIATSSRICRALRQVS